MADYRRKFGVAARYSQTPEGGVWDAVLLGGSGDLSQLGIQTVPPTGQLRHPIMRSCLVFALSKVLPVILLGS